MRRLVFKILLGAEIVWLLFSNPGILVHAGRVTTFVWIIDVYVDIEVIQNLYEFAGVAVAQHSNLLVAKLLQLLQNLLLLVLAQILVGLRIDHVISLKRLNRILCPKVLAWIVLHSIHGRVSTHVHLLLLLLQGYRQYSQWRKSLGEWSVSRRLIRSIIKKFEKKLLKIKSMGVVWGKKEDNTNFETIEKWLNGFVTLHSSYRVVLQVMVLLVLLAVHSPATKCLLLVCALVLHLFIELIGSLIEVVKLLCCFQIIVAGSHTLSFYVFLWWALQEFSNLYYIK